MEIAELLERLSAGQWTDGEQLFYGGIAGIVAGVLAIVVCLCVFPRRRKRLLRKLGEEQR